MKTSNNNKQKVSSSSKETTRLSVTKSLSASFYCEKGQIQLNDGNLLQALEYFQAAIDVDNENIEALSGLYEVWHRMGKLNKADEIQKILNTLYKAQTTPDQRPPKHHGEKQKRGKKRAKDRLTFSLMSVVLVTLAYLGAFFTPIISASMQLRYETDGYIPVFVNHLLTFLPGIWFLTKGKATRKTKSFLLGMLIGIPFLYSYLFGRFSPAYYFYGFDYYSMIVFVLLDLIFLGLFLYNLSEFENKRLLYKIFNVQLGQLLLGFLLAIPIVGVINWLMLKSNVIVVMADSILGSIVGVVSMSVVILVIVAFMLLYFLFK